MSRNCVGDYLFSDIKRYKSVKNFNNASGCFTCTALRCKSLSIAESLKKPVDVLFVIFIILGLPSQRHLLFYLGPIRCLELHTDLSFL